MNKLNNNSLVFAVLFGIIFVFFQAVIAFLAGFGGANFLSITLYSSLPLMLFVYPVVLYLLFSQLSKVRFSKKKINPLNIVLVFIAFLIFLVFAYYIGISILWSYSQR